MPGRVTCKDPRSKCLGKTIRGDLWVWFGKTRYWFSCVMRGFQLCVNMSWAEMWIWVLQKSAESQQRCSSIIYLSIACLTGRFRVLHRLELINTSSLRWQSSPKSPARRRVPRALRFAVRVVGWILWKLPACGMCRWRAIVSEKLKRIYIECGERCGIDGGKGDWCTSKIMCFFFGTASRRQLCWRPWKRCIGP